MIRLFGSGRYRKGQLLELLELLEQLLAAARTAAARTAAAQWLGLATDGRLFLTSSGGQLMIDEW